MSAQRVAALYYDGEGRVLLTRSESGETWHLPSAETDEAAGEESWEAASRAMARLGYEAMGLRTIAEESGTEYWLMAGRSSSYRDPGDFYDPSELPPLTDSAEAGVIEAGKPASG
ncbi:MAG: hypothetical protein DCC49_03920 [Acidobacteria bacterium]|nr:MAG: hypothetical protein DCC49_03920 [Acidobacteriota bacterium]